MAISAEVGQSLEGIVASIGQTTQLVDEITVASQEQALGITQVNTAVSHIDQVTQKNAITAEGSAGASAKLKSQAQSMQEAVHALVALVNGRHERA